MTDRITHRGPDSEGHWIDPESRVFLGHRRLSILDLSSSGAQPMTSHDGRYTVAFNGEIYNYPDLRKDLESKGVSFRGTSDTEVMLELISRIGFERTLPLLNGMFAIALWDKSEKTLYLTRDRYGEKPLYYGWMGETFLFGSELKSLRAFPGFRAEVDRDALTLFIRLGYVPTPRSIYSGIQKLPGGTFLKLRASGRIEAPTLGTYDSVKETCVRSLKSVFEGPEDKILSDLEVLLKDAVRIRMQADVPLGAFLSGGIDSSLIVALMQAQSTRPVQTFSIGFHEKRYNEAEYARAVATHLKTEHTDLYIKPEEAQAVIPQLADLFDEPFADSSQIPTYLVSKLARQKVTVSLSGDAGDELFGGYERYRWGERIWRSRQHWPDWSLRLSQRALGLLSPQAWNHVFETMGPVLPGRLLASHPADKLQKFRDLLSLKTQGEIYLHLVSQVRDPQSIVLGSHAISSPHADLDLLTEFSSFPDKMMFLDLITYLPDDILVKVDRASMGVSLEGRIPFLDPRVVEFAWRLPPHMKIRGRTTKWALRQLLYRHVPQHLIDRPKMGFGVPIDSWLRGPLRDWAESLLSPERIRREGFFDSDAIQNLWRAHLDGTQNCQHSLWNILSFQMWHARWGTE